MNTLSRWSGITIIGILLAGLLGGIFLPSIEAALTLPRDSRTIAVPPQTQQPAPAQTATKVTTPGAMILAQDTFQRANQALWGTAQDGHAWGGDANTLPNFSIVGGTGQVNGISAMNGFYDAILGPSITDAEVVFSGSISHLNPSNLGSVLRWTDKNDYYKAYIDGISLVIVKKAAGMAVRLGAASFPAKTATFYTLRFRIAGTMLRAKVWQTGNNEPPNWMITVADNTLQAGFGGLRLLLEHNVIAHITLFTETAV